jgi:septum formation protein
MILSLSNRTHRVLSGLALVGPGGRILFRDCVTSRVSFGPIPPVELQAYLKTREPYDKAGGYGIQGTARRWVTCLEGDYFNVMGLPVSRVLEALIRHGLWRKRQKP